MLQKESIVMHPYAFLTLFEDVTFECCFCHKKILIDNDFKKILGRI